MSKYNDYRHKSDFVIPEAMQALVACGSGFKNLQVRQVPVPRVGPEQLLARVDAAGVCTSILKLIEQGEKHPFINGWDMKKWPVILGDEGAVTLVKVGENLKHKYHPGQRYAIQPAVDVAPILHRQRYNNNAKDMHKCAVGYTLGGHLAQYICIQQEVLAGQCLLPLPDDDMPYFAVSMAEPVSCVYSAQQRSCHIIKKSPHSNRRRLQLGLLSGGLTVVIGAGPMGAMHAELALRFSPRVLFVTDLQQGRLDKVVKNIGQRANSKSCKLVCVLPDKLPAAVKQESNNAGADDVILALGVQSAHQDALKLLAPGGVANLFGGLPRGSHTLELDSQDVHYRDIRLVGSSGGEPSDMAAALKAIADEEIDPGNYVAAVGSLDSAIDVLKMLEQTRINGRAVLYPHIKQAPLQPVDYWDKNKEIEFLDTHLP